MASRMDDLPFGSKHALSGILGYNWLPRENTLKAEGAILFPRLDQVSESGWIRLCYKVTRGGNYA